MACVGTHTATFIAGISGATSTSGVAVYVGAPQTVRYHFVNAMLLNEVQKQRRQLEAQEAEILELRAQQALVQELRERLARLEAGLAQ